jgi:hypothetical protein
MVDVKQAEVRRIDLMRAICPKSARQIFPVIEQGSR